MPDKLIFLPILIQIALTLYLYIPLVQTKLTAVRNKDYDRSRIMLHDDGWPDNVIQINNNITNQFQLPILFYVLIGVLWATETITLFDHIIAWLFVIGRIVHSYVHTGANTQPLRRQVFTFGYVMIWLLVVSAVISLFI